ncbi:DNA (cytosine-5)-methyltransferase 1-like isoform X1 [Dorcoceras hygrometricum]|uniref:DNA (Cytosine-5)-methyltransferase 1-like isoform X1 n=1 Tax=Dorcoceras hygrometricum TaxID=472368 RepID=A0A2Z6ZWE2_9LAMI|nr:DNA (cytosine-5)-methyltransferase 1-like isoform X1 [Dorcoceras hygrometricum]
MTFRVVRTNQYNQDLGLIHSTNGNHLESPKEGSSIDHQVTIYLHAQNITMFPTNETWYFASQILVSNSGGLILILTAQSTRNMLRIHSKGFVPEPISLQSACTRRLKDFIANGFSSSNWPERISGEEGGGGGGGGGL